MRSKDLIGYAAWGLPQGPAFACTLTRLNKTKKQKLNYPSQGPQQTLFFQLALIQNLFPEMGDGNDSSDGDGADDDCDDGW